jgi:SulP family sulfate permease
LPGAIVALVAGTFVAATVGLPVATIATRTEAFPSSWPAFSLPVLPADKILAQLPAAFAIAMLAAIESLRTTGEADRLTGDRHNPNVELVAVGLANVASPFAGGLPAAGGVARTLAGIRAGARTPMAGLVHALTILAIVAWAAPFAGLVPMPVVAAIVLAIAWTTSDWQEIRDVIRSGPIDAAVWATTVALVVFADLTQAVPVALALGALLFIRRVAATVEATDVADELEVRRRADPAQDQEIPAFVAAFRVTGPLLHGGIDALDVIRARLDGLPPIVVVRLRYVTAIDAAGLQALEDLARDVRATGRVLLVAGAREQPLAVMRRARFETRLGPDHLCPAFEDALTRARHIHADRFSGAWPNIAAPVPAPAENRPESGDESVAHIR